MIPNGLSCVKGKSIHPSGSINSFFKTAISWLDPARISIIFGEYDSSCLTSIYNLNNVIKVRFRNVNVKECGCGPSDCQNKSCEDESSWETPKPGLKEDSEIWKDFSSFRFSNEFISKNNIFGKQALIAFAWYFQVDLHSYEFLKNCRCILKAALNLHSKIIGILTKSSKLIFQPTANRGKKLRFVDTTNFDAKKMTETPPISAKILGIIPFHSIFQRLPGFVALIFIPFCLFAPFYFELLYIIYYYWLHFVFIFGTVRQLWGSIAAYRRSVKLHFDFNQLEDIKTSSVLHVIIIPQYKEQIETVTETLDVLASHSLARQSYKV